MVQASKNSISRRATILGHQHLNVLHAMFKPTQPLQARVAARLKGYRGPTLKLLRRVVRTVHPSARLRPINGPGAKYSNFTPKGLTTLRAWKSQHIALERLLPRFTNETQNTKELFQWRRYPERIEAPAPVDVSGQAVSKLPKLCRKIKRPIGAFCSRPRLVKC